MICLLKSLTEVSHLTFILNDYCKNLTLIPVNQMSTRVDALEASIQDIINGDVVSVPQSPASAAPGGIR